MVGQSFVQRSLARQEGYGIVFEPPQSKPLPKAFRLLLRLDPAPEAARQRPASRSDVIGEQLGCFVMTGDKSPKQAVFDDRERCRRDDAHVLQVDEMHRRDAAEMAVAHVQVVPAGPGRSQQHGLVGGIRNDPHDITQVKRTRLGGNVRSGKVVIGKGTHVVATVLGEHLARGLVQEVVNHHPGRTRSGA